MEIKLDDIRHGIRVASIAREIANYLNLSKSAKDDLYVSCLFHDIGKAHIKPEILHKNGKLNEMERKIVEKHSFFSYLELKELGYSNSISKVVLHHHENYDGTGYPEGLKGNQIPFNSRIIKVADVFDALTMDRPYRKKLSIETAIEIMEGEKEKYDSLIFKVFKDIINYKILKGEIAL